MLLVACALAAPGGEYPPLPANATLRQQQDFESGKVGSSFTANQCAGNNNVIATDPFEGKVWEAWWNFGDPAVAAHPVRCEMDPFGNDAAGEYVYRMKFKVPTDSFLPTTSSSAWHYRLQFHGDAPSTSPPIAMWTARGSTNDRFRLRFAAGDSSWSQTRWFGDYADGAWHTVQIHVNWQPNTSGWVEFHVDGQPITTNSGGVRLRGKTLRTSKGTPSVVYLKYGLNGGTALKNEIGRAGSFLHGYVAHVRKWRVGP
jgi:hypothetical protein